MHDAPPSWVPTDEQLKVMQDILNRIIYKHDGNYRFDLVKEKDEAHGVEEIDTLRITFVAQSSCGDDEGQDKILHWYTHLPDELEPYLGDDYQFERAFLTFVFRELVASEVHEVAEWFRYEADGREQRPFNPHKTNVEMYARDITIKDGPMALVMTPEHPYGW